MEDASSRTAVGGKTTVGSLYATLLFIFRDGPQRDLICADVHDELHITTSTLPPTQP